MQCGFCTSSQQMSGLGQVSALDECPLLFHLNGNHARLTSGFPPVRSRFDLVPSDLFHRQLLRPVLSHLTGANDALGYQSCHRHLTVHCVQGLCPPFLCTLGSVHRVIKLTRLHEQISLMRKLVCISISRIKINVAKLFIEILSTNQIYDTHERVGNSRSAEKSRGGLNATRGCFLLRLGQAVHERSRSDPCTSWEERLFQSVCDFRVKASFGVHRLYFKALTHLWRDAQGVRGLLFRFHP